MVNPARLARIYLEDGTRLPVSQIVGVVRSFAPDYTPTFAKSATGEYVRLEKPDPTPVYTLYTLQGHALLLSPKDYAILRLYTRHRDLPFWVVQDTHLVHMDLAVCTPTPSSALRSQDTYRVRLHPDVFLDISAVEYAELRARDAHIPTLDVQREPDMFWQVERLNRQVAAE